MLRIQPFKMKQYAPKMWQITFGEIAPETVQRGKNKGKPHPQTGEILWQETKTKYPGNIRYAIDHIIDYYLKNLEFEVKDLEDVQKMLQTLDRHILELTEKIETILIEGDKFILDAK